MEKSASHGSHDALKMLEQDHEHVKRLFKDFEKLSAKDAGRKAELVAEVCQQLTVHAALEEELFYPSIKAAVKASELDEAKVEHAQQRGMVEQLQSMEPGDSLYDATVTVLGEYVNHHVKEEESEIFPQVRKGDIDIASLGKQMLERRESLMEETSNASTASRKTHKSAPTHHARH
ncbi:MAG TPA: hemerythrin domain-containing protein [Acidiferrobacteraceae bacterium]|nr:hemerythrin domain-containing protein [Acidiferrobacteraceae bacterium]